MNVGIGNIDAQFLFWDYLFRILGIVFDLPVQAQKLVLNFEFKSFCLKTRGTQLHLAVSSNRCGM